MRLGDPPVWRAVDWHPASASASSVKVNKALAQLLFMGPSAWRAWCEPFRARLKLRPRCCALPERGPVAGAVSITGWVRVVSTRRRWIVGSVGRGRCCADGGTDRGACRQTGAGTVPGPAIDRRVPIRAAAPRTTIATDVTAESKGIDEQCSGAARSTQTSLEHRDVKRQGGSISSGDLSVTTASSTSDPSPPRTDTVAFGGSVAKLSLPSSHCMMNCLVATCPAARTGRSAKTIAFAELPSGSICRLQAWRRQS